MGGRDGPPRQTQYRITPYPVLRCKSVATPLTRLKFYTARFAHEPDFDSEGIEVARNHLREEFYEEQLKSRSGFGFSILSYGALNVCMWGNDNCETPRLLFQDAYVFDTVGNRPTAHMRLSDADLTEQGTLDVWELAIAGHEAAAWRNYLDSPRVTRHKTRYLRNRLSGIIT